MTSLHVGLLPALIVAIASALTACSASATASDQVRIDLPDASSNIRNGWFLNVSIDNGTSRRVQVDTGSVGLAIGAPAIPLSAKKLSSGSITYSSSGEDALRRRVSRHDCVHGS